MAVNARERLVRMHGAAEPAPLARAVLPRPPPRRPRATALRAGRRRPAAARGHLQLRAGHAASACAGCWRCARSPRGCASSGSCRPGTDAARAGRRGGATGGRPERDALAGRRLRPARSRRRARAWPARWPHAATIVADGRPLRVAYSGPPARPTGPLCLLDGFLDNGRELSVALQHACRLIARGAAGRRLAALGAGLPARMRGDFALLVWDGERGEGLLARDQLGVRSLFLHERRRAALRQRDAPPAGAAAAAPGARSRRASRTGSR